MIEDCEEKSEGPSKKRQLNDAVYKVAKDLSDKVERHEMYFFINSLRTFLSL